MEENFMIYELRIYHVNEGKLPELHDRFKDITFDFFKKYNIEVCDFFVDATGLERCYYILGYENEQDRELKWSAFENDPEWIEKREKTNENGRIVSKVESFLMNRVPYVNPNW